MTPMKSSSRERAHARSASSGHRNGCSDASKSYARVVCVVTGAVEEPAPITRSRKTDEVVEVAKGSFVASRRASTAEITFVTIAIAPSASSVKGKMASC